MPTLRQNIQAAVDSLTAQIQAAKQTATATITPLQAQLDLTQAQLVQFGPWLDQDVTTVKAQVTTQLTQLGA